MMKMRLLHAVSSWSYGQVRLHSKLVLLVLFPKALRPNILEKMVIFEFEDSGGINMERNRKIHACPLGTEARISVDESSDVGQ